MRKPIPTWNFVLVVVRRNDEFLMIQEAKHGNQWYFPAGRVEPGETFADAAVRETLEEAGMAVRLTGILRIEHSPRLQGSRMRVIYLAESVDDRSPKSVADEESLQARWVKPEDLIHYDLRGADVLEVVQYARKCRNVCSVDLIQPEGNTYRFEPPELPE